MKNQGCWARKLGGCDEKLTGDHLVSAAAWRGADRPAKLKTKIRFMRGQALPDGSVDTSHPDGFSRSMTVNTLTANVLCRTHNPALSEVDTEAGKLTDAILEFRRLWDKRWIPNLQYTPRLFEVDGPKIERWFIKTIITITAHWGLRIGSRHAEVGTPSDELVDIAYGLREPFGRIGLAAAFALGRERVQTNSFSFYPWRTVPAKDPSKTYIAGCIAEFRSFRFVLNLDPDRPVPMERVREQPGWEQMQLLQPLRGITNEQMNMTLRFVWPSHRYETLA